jgi:hypothetical protein
MRFFDAFDCFVAAWGADSADHPALVLHALKRRAASHLQWPGLAPAIAMSGS